jgi:hypothetical protein
MDDPDVPDGIKQKLFAEGVRHRKEQRIRQELKGRGYRLMRRRCGAYWVIFEKALSLDEIEQKFNEPFYD